MWQYLAKILVTSVVIAAISEIAKRNALWAALLASLPLTSLMAFVWIYLESGDAGRVAELSRGIFWLVLPSLPLFLSLGALIKQGAGFWPSLAVSCLIAVIAYLGMLWALARAGLRI